MRPGWLAQAAFVLALPHFLSSAVPQGVLTTDSALSLPSRQWTRTHSAISVSKMQRPSHLLHSRFPRVLSAPCGEAVKNAGSSIAPCPVNSHQQDRRQRNKPNSTTQRKSRNIITIASLRSHQISHLIQNHSATDPESYRRRKRQRRVARPKRQNERCRKSKFTSRGQLRRSY